MSENPDVTLLRFGQRLMELMRHLGIRSEKAFAKRLGIHPNTLTRYKQGTGSPDLKFITFLCDEFNISMGWLLHSDLTQTLEDQWIARGFAADGSTIPGQPTLPPYIIPADQSDDPEEKSEDALINIPLLLRLTKIVSSLHAESGIRLSTENLYSLAAQLYNEMMDTLSDPGDPDEIDATLPLVRHNLKKQLGKAAAAPGTGKREAS